MTNNETKVHLNSLRDDVWYDDGYGHETKEYEDTIEAIDNALTALEVLDKIKEKYIQYDHLYSNSVEDRSNFRNVFANAVCNIMYETYRDDTFKI